MDGEHETDDNDDDTDDTDNTDNDDKKKYLLVVGLTSMVLWTTM